MNAQNCDLVINNGRVMDPETRYDAIANVGIKRGRSSGISYVIVHGIVVMKDSESLKRFDAGQPIRFEPQKEGNFLPLSIESWPQEFYVAP